MPHQLDLPFYRYAYSGSDARAYCYFEGRGDRVSLLESLHTISWSVHEAKGPARSLGYRSVKGFASGIRTVAGSLITTVIEDHPLAPLMELAEELRWDPNLLWPGWSVDRYLTGVGSGIDGTSFRRRLAPTLPPFNILIQYVAEGSQWRQDKNSEFDLHIPGAAVLLKGVELVDEGMVTSTSDAASEMTYSFMALDCKTISMQEFLLTLQFVTPNPAQEKAERVRSKIAIDQRAKLDQYKSTTNEMQINGTFIPGGASFE